MATTLYKPTIIAFIICIGLMKIECGKDSFATEQEESEFSAPASGSIYLGMPVEDQTEDGWNPFIADSGDDVKIETYAATASKGKTKRRLYEPAPASATVGLLESHPHGKPKRPIFCYYGTSANTRPSVGKFFPENIDPFLCTHVIFAFVDIKKDGTGIKPNNIDDLTDRGLYARTTALKQKNPDLKILLAVGGWKIGSKPFLPVIKDRSTWTVWISHVIEYLREKNFDGFDMDWEFPGWRGSGPEDRHKFTLLMKDMHEAFAHESQETGKPRLLLTLATASSVFYIEKSYEQEEIHKHIDYMFLMTYNYHGSGWEKHTGHHSPLLPHPLDPEGEQRELFVLWSVKYWLQYGVPKEKLIMGIPTYGLGWKLTDPSKTGVRAPADGGNSPGKYSGESGILAHYEICEHIIQDGWKVEWIGSQKVPYAHGDNEWIGFESPDSIYIKALTILREGLGGAFIWSVEMDDFNGHCGGPKYPLLRTVYEVFTKAMLSSSLSAPASSHNRASSSASRSSSLIHGHSHPHQPHHQEEQQFHNEEQQQQHGEEKKEKEEEHKKEETKDPDYYSSYYDYNYDYGSSSHSSPKEYENLEYDYANSYHYDDDKSGAPQDEASSDCQKLGLGIHPDPVSCHHFLLCVPSSATALGPTRMSCPDGTMFDRNLKICNHEQAVDCFY